MFITLADFPPSKKDNRNDLTLRITLWYNI